MFQIRTHTQTNSVEYHVESVLSHGSCGSDASRSMLKHRAILSARGAQPASTPPTGLQQHNLQAESKNESTNRIMVNKEEDTVKDRKRTRKILRDTDR